MKNRQLYVIAVLLYLSMVVALVAVYCYSSDENARLIGMNVVSTALMTITLILAVLFMKNNEKQKMYDELEKLQEKDWKD